MKNIHRNNRKMNFSEMEKITAGYSNRACFIDGMITLVAIGFGGVLGAVGGIYAMNANHCFD